MKTIEAIEKRRSIRKFTEDAVSPALLTELVRLGRLYSSAVNAQPIRFAIVARRENTDFLFEHLNWAMRLHPYPIEKTERATAYLLLLGKEQESDFFEFDAGSCAATVMLAAQSMALSSCCLKITKREEIRSYLKTGEYVPYYAIALGKAGVESKIVEATDSVAYYLSPEGDFRVPKRSVDEILIYNDSQK